jgi:hypothetical protein
MIVKKISEYGLEEAALGFSLSYNSNPERAKQIFPKYAHGIPGEGKFLESIITYWDVNAPRYWWSESDTYRVGTSKQSESTIHTITKRVLSQEDFESHIFQPTLDNLNDYIVEFQNSKDKDRKSILFEKIKTNLPEGFLQRRIWMLSYKTIQNIVYQRSNHKLRQWHYFIDVVLNSLEHKEYIIKEQSS